MRRYLFLGMLSLFVVSPVSARLVGESGDFGAGVVLGSPTGLTAKYWLGGHRAIDGTLAWKFGHEDQLEIAADHLWHHTFPNSSASVRGWLPFYFGLGVRVLAGDDAEAGVRIPLGLSYMVQDAPVEFFAEIVPVVEFAPDTDADIDGGIGVRYYFNPGF